MMNAGKYVYVSMFFSNRPTKAISPTALILEKKKNTNKKKTNEH